MPGFGYLEVKCLGCNTHQTVALDIVRRPKTTPVHELERYMRCKDCSRGPGLSLQAEPSGGAARDQDHGERSALDVVAGRAVSIMPATLTVDTTGKAARGCREAEELLGYSASEAVGQSIEIIIAASPEAPA